jgi:hypothetical protein
MKEGRLQDCEKDGDLAVKLRTTMCTQRHEKGVRIRDPVPLGLCFRWGHLVAADLPHLQWIP